jgi:hypothetical protein
MNRPIPLALSFTAGLALCASLTVLLDKPCQDVAEPPPADTGQLLGAIPRSREHAAVMSWIFEHRADAKALEFLAWLPARPVADNPITHGPATLVQLTVKNRSSVEERVEHLSFYLENLDVLGSVSEPHVGQMTAICA